MNDFYFPQPFGGQYGQYGQTWQAPQRREVLFVNDAASAGRLPLLPGESALALNYTDDILYFVQSDAAGSIAVRDFEYKPREQRVDEAAGGTASVAFSFIYVTPAQACCDPPNVTLVNSGSAGTVTNVALTAHRLC